MAPDSAIEHAIHFRVRDLSLLLQPLEYRLAAPGTALENHFQSIRQHARNVVNQAAAGDVRQCSRLNGDLRPSASATA